MSFPTRVILAAASLLCLLSAGCAQLGCSGNQCPDESTCSTLGGAPVCVCPDDLYSRILDGVCTNKPLLRWGYLDPHNAARAPFGLSSLSWDTSLASEAQKWADSLARNQNCQLAIQRRTRWGQNVANFFNDPSFMNDDAVNIWVRQGRRYRYARFDSQGSAGCTTGNWQDCAAYTQVIWEDTKRIGCGVARCPRSKGKVWVCNYTPAGNIIGEFPFKR